MSTEKAAVRAEAELAWTPSTSRCWWRQTQARRRLRRGPSASSRDPTASRGLTSIRSFVLALPAAEVCLEPRPLACRHAFRPAGRCESYFSRSADALKPCVLGHFNSVTHYSAALPIPTKNYRWSSRRDAARRRAASSVRPGRVSAWPRVLSHHIRF